jgi:hypothetical protein
MMMAILTKRQDTKIKRRRNERYTEVCDSRGQTYNVEMFNLILVLKELCNPQKPPQGQQYLLTQFFR